MKTPDNLIKVYCQFNILDDNNTLAGISINKAVIPLSDVHSYHEYKSNDLEYGYQIMGSEEDVTSIELEQIESYLNKSRIKIHFYNCSEMVIFMSFDLFDTLKRNYDNYYNNLKIQAKFN